MKVSDAMGEIEELRELYKVLDSKAMFYKDIQNMNPSIKKTYKETEERLTAINKRIFVLLNKEVKE